MKHTCKAQGRFGHKMAGCPRCEELNEGAPKRSYMKKNKLPVPPTYTAIRAAMDAHDWNEANRLIDIEHAGATDTMDKAEWLLAALALERKNIFRCIRAMRRACHLPEWPRGVPVAVADRALIKEVKPSAETRPEPVYIPMGQPGGYIPPEQRRDPNRPRSKKGLATFVIVKRRDAQAPARGWNREQAPPPPQPKPLANGAGEATEATEAAPAQAIISNQRQSIETTTETKNNSSNHEF